MIVKECMSQQPFYMPPDASLQEACQKMREFDYGFIPIGENDRLIGTVTDRDIALRAVAEGFNPSETELRQCMSNKVLYCYEDEEISAAAANMERNKIQRLIVLNREKRMTGILSFKDIVKSDDDNLCGHLLEEVKAA